MENYITKTIPTCDNVNIPIYQIGDSKKTSLIILPGLTGTIESYLSIISNPYLLHNYQVIYMDYRAHFPKQKNITHGMNIARLSADLSAVINQLNLDKVVLLGHSIGCSVIWSYIELFGQKNIKKIILIDQSPTIMSTCHDYPDFVDSDYLMHIKQFYEFTCQLANEDKFYDVFCKHFENGFVSEASKKNGVLDSWLNAIPAMNYLCLQRMMVDSLTRDWRDMLHLISIPTLVIGGKASMVPWQTQVWVSEQIPNSTLKILEKEEGGYHAMFLEEKGMVVLNKSINDFLGCKDN